MESISKILLAISVSLLAGVVYLYTPQVEKALELYKHHTCAQDYRMEFQQGDTTLFQPIVDQYQKCITSR